MPDNISLDVPYMMEIACNGVIYSMHSFIDNFGMLLEVKSSVQPDAEVAYRFIETGSEGLVRSRVR